MTDSDWTCTICTEKGHPVMIITCGHTYCESCLERITQCPNCRITFSRTDLQTNWCLVGRATQSRKRPRPDADRMLQEVTNKRLRLEKQTLRGLVLAISEQLTRSMQDHPLAASYIVSLPGLTDGLYDQLYSYLARYHPSISISEFNWSSNPPEAKIKIIAPPPAPPVRRQLFPTQQFAVYNPFFPQTPQASAIPPPPPPTPHEHGEEEWQDDHEADSVS